MQISTAQTAINDTGAAPDASAALDVQSTSKGILIPRMTTSKRVSISNPATGLLVFDNQKEAFFFYDGTAWQQWDTFTDGVINDADDNTKVEVEQTTDDDVIRFSTAGAERVSISENNAGQPALFLANSLTAIGENAGAASGLNSSNTFLGNGAGQFTNNNFNTFIGAEAGQLGTGERNTLIGSGAGTNTGTASYMVLTGAFAGENISNGSNTVAVGYNAGQNSAGASSIFIGHEAGKNYSGDGLLAIDNSSTNNALLSGTDNSLAIAGNLSLQENIALTGSSMGRGGTGFFVSDDGIVGFNQNPPQSQFNIAGDMKVDGDLILNTNKHPLGIDNVRIVCGRVNADGTLDNSATNNEIVLTERISEGDYHIEFDGTFILSLPVVMITAFQNSPTELNRYAQVQDWDSNELWVSIKNQSGGDRDAPFNFIIILQDNNGN